MLVRKSEKGEILVFDSTDNFIASFRNGQWIGDLIFQLYELDEYFWIVEDINEARKLIEEARTTLNRPLPDEP